MVRQAQRRERGLGMRVLLVGVLVLAALTGCTAGERDSNSSPPGQASGPISADPTGTIPADNPAAPREDSLGRAPADVVVALTDALASRDWKTAYSLYATPTPNAEMAAKDWSEAYQRYTALRVHETRVADSGRAWVRVTYTRTTTPMGSSSYSLTVAEPGQWWPVYKVGGQWKVGWMPRP
jgi:hypothetical protein